MRLRWEEHRSALISGTHSNTDLQSDWSYYGPRAFAFETLEIVRDESAIEGRETYWLARYRSVGECYNIMAVSRPRRRRGERIITIPGDIELSDHMPTDDILRMLALAKDTDQQYAYPPEKIARLLRKEKPEQETLARIVELRR